MRDILLLDNGSKRADATLSLRSIAERLATRLGEHVHPVSVLHADQVPADRLGGQPAATFAPFLKARIERGTREFLIVPLFFGPSRAITQFIPETVATLEGDMGPLDLQVTSPLCPLPAGESRLVDLLQAQILETAERTGVVPSRVILVDHGSPIPTVTAVRRWLRDRLAERLGRDTDVGEAVMERRASAAYDFNGDLLSDRLRALAREDPIRPVILAMLFLSPGRHAGPDGDIAEICASVAREHPGLPIHQTPLVGSHPILIDILASRVRTG
jgi:sirohydrochlorin ferrochelatase